MPGPRQTASIARRPRGLSFALSLAATGLLFGAGCQEDNHVATTGDPFLGGQAALPASPPPPVQTANPTLPPPPLAFAPATAPAALASGTPANFDRSQELQIGNSVGAPANGYANPPAPQGPGVLLRPPDTANLQPHSDPAFTPAAAQASNSAGSYEQLRAQLLARGVTDMRLETWGSPSAWKFTCSMPNRQNPAKIRTYEAQAQDELAAMRAVLDKMDKDQ